MLASLAQGGTRTQLALAPDPSGRTMGYMPGPACISLQLEKPVHSSKNSLSQALQPHRCRIGARSVPVDPF